MQTVLELQLLHPVITLEQVTQLANPVSANPVFEHTQLVPDCTLFPPQLVQFVELFVHVAQAALHVAHAATPAS